MNLAVRGHRRMGVSTVTVGRLDLHDLRAALLVASATTLFGLVRTGVDIPGMHHERLLAGSIFLLGMFACGAGVRQDAFSEPRVTSRFVALLLLLGATALGVGALAVILAMKTLTDVLVVLVLGLWVGATLRHALTPVPPATSAAATRVKELTS